MPSKKPATFLEFCDMVSPCIVRAMAMNGDKLMTLDEIAEASGLPRRTVQRIGSSKSWSDIKLGTASKFLKGCGVDMVDREEQMKDFIAKTDQGLAHMDSKQKHNFLKVMGWL